jgi:DNA-binding NtrC family response regulator
MLENIENPGRVLLLEDEPTIGRATTRILLTEGFDVDIAINGLIAKDKIDADDNYEFFIFDIKMPIMNGIQLYEYMEQEHPELIEKVIFITGDSLGVVTKDFLERVNRPFLNKPYTPAQLIELIREVFGVRAVYQ